MVLSYQSVKIRGVSAAYKTLLASLRGLAILLVLSAAARLARTTALGFVSDSVKHSIVPRLHACAAITVRACDIAGRISDITL